MSETKNVILAIIIINALAIGAIFTTLEDNSVDTSTSVTAQLVVKFMNLGNNETKIFDNVTTTESTVYGILLTAQTEGNYSVTATTHYEFGLFVESIYGWGNCGGCQNEDGFYWTYSINSINGEIAANRNLIDDGDIIEWTYTDQY